MLLVLVGGVIPKALDTIAWKATRRHENVHADVQDHDPEGGPDRTTHHLFEGFALKQETDQGDEPDENGNLREKIVRQRRSDIGNEIH